MSFGTVVSSFALTLPTPKTCRGRCCNPTLHRPLCDSQRESSIGCLDPLTFSIHADTAKPKIVPCTPFNSPFVVFTLLNAPRTAKRHRVVDSIVPKFAFLECVSQILDCVAGIGIHDPVFWCEEAHHRECQWCVGVMLRWLCCFRRRCTLFEFTRTMGRPLGVRQ